MSEKSIMVPKNEQNPRFGEINEQKPPFKSTNYM